MTNTSSLTDWPRWRSPRSKRFWLLALLLLYTVGGFVVVPWALKNQLPALGQTYLKRDAAVERVAFNPWVLRLRAWGFAINDTDGSPLVTVDELDVNLQLRSVLRLGLVFRDVILVNPRIEVARRKFGDSNIGDWVNDLTAPDPAAPAADPDAAGLPIVIDNLNIAAAQVDITDRLPATEFNTTLGPINIALQNLSTVPNESGAQDVTITAENGATLSWTGSLQISPFASAGKLRLDGSPLPAVHRYLADQLNFDLDSCCMEVELDYTVAALADGSVSAAINGANLAVRELQLTARDTGALLLDLPELVVRDGELAWPAATARIGAIELNDIRTNTWLDESGELNLLQLLVAAPDAGAAAAAADDDAAAFAWDATVDSVAINRMTVNFADRQLAPAGELTIADLNLSLSELRTTPGAAAPLTLDLRLAGGGTLNATGSVQLLPEADVQTELRLDQLALAQLQPWVQDAAQVAINTGSVDMTATLTSNRSETLAVNANIAVNALGVSDTLENKPLVGWQTLVLDDLRLALDQNALELSAVNLREPFARVIIAADGSTNFAALATAPAAETPAETAAPAQTDPAALVIKVGKSTVSNGAVDFSDLSLPLPFQANISELSGSLSALASNSSQPSTLALEGKVGEYGLTTVDGLLNVLDPTQQADVKVKFRNVSMPDLSPYTAEFAGRKIESGKLDLNLEYVFAERLMRGDNEVVLTQFELGDKVDHPDAMSLPLDLAVALLRDVNGVIDLKLGVSGDLDDPEFSAGGVILKAFANLITKLAAAPFKLLGKLVPGGGADGVELDSIAFQPGRADLAPPEREKLAQLGSALAERPALTLDVPGGYNEKIDTPALQAAAVEAQIASALGDKAAGDDEQLLRRTRRVLEQLAEDANALGGLSLRELREQFDVVDASTGETTFDEVAYMASLREQLAAVQEVASGELEALASARSAAIQAELLQRELGSDRVRLQATAPATAAEDGWVRIKLGLEVSEATAAATEPASVPAAEPSAGLQPGRPAGQAAQLIR